MILLFVLKVVATVENQGVRDVRCEKIPRLPFYYSLSVILSGIQSQSNNASQTYIHSNRSLYYYKFSTKIILIIIITMWKKTTFTT